MEIWNSSYGKLLEAQETGNLKPDKQRQIVWVKVCSYVSVTYSPWVHKDYRVFNTLCIGKVFDYERDLEPDFMNQWSRSLMQWKQLQIGNKRPGFY